MRLLLLAAFSAALIPLTATAQHITREDQVVRSIGPGAFEVPWRGRSGPRDFWCAAGDCARYELNLPGNTRLFRTSPLPRRSGEAVRFSLSPEGAHPTGLALIGGGNSISVAHARLQCDRR